MTETLALYLGGLRVPCEAVDPAGLESEAPDLPAGNSGAPLRMTRLSGPAPDGWISVPRGFARPRPAPEESLSPLSPEHFHAMRGLYGLFCGRFPGMLAREDPAGWQARLSRLNRPLGLFEGDRLLLWLDERGGELLELSAAPDALPRISGALAAAGIARAPAPLLGVPAEEFDMALKLRLLKPFQLPDKRIETAAQLARAMESAVQWDEI